jgi:hypothetical protein
LGNCATAEYEAVVDLALGAEFMLLAMEGVESLGIDLNVLSPLIGSGARRVGLPALKSALPAQPSNQGHACNLTKT